MTQNPIHAPSSQSSFTTLLNQSAKDLAAYLEHILPAVFDDWWQTGVMSKLSYQQQQRTSQSGLTSLSGLDLAALLRVLDGNWYEISKKVRLTHEDRHFVKEMQTIRNKWAHINTEGFPFDDVYRDLDTLQRFVSIIEGDKALIQKISSVKTALIGSQSPTPLAPPAHTTSAQEAKNGSSCDTFKPGQIVFLKSNPEITGAVLSVIQGSPEARYDVFLGDGKKSFYASQIQADVPEKEEMTILSCQKFHAFLSALQIQNPGLSTLYSLNAARIDFIPYQFRPVLKFIRSDRPRLLIADGVGVGKTIEAGLILREIQARRDVRSVLIICPRLLVTEKKWENEMKRFGERFSHLDGPALRYCTKEMDKEMDMDGEWPEQYSMYPSLFPI